MYLILNDNNEIKGVGVTTNPAYHSEYVDENAEMYPFKDKSVAFMCCYRVSITDGIINSLTPYIDSRLIEHLDQLGKGEELNTEDITDTQLALAETYEEVGDNTSDIDICMNAIAEIWEAIGE